MSSGWSNKFQLTRGFLNATQFIFGQNRTGCQFGSENIWHAGDEGKIMLERYGFKYFNILASLDQFLMVSYSLHNITYDCYYGVKEVDTLRKAYQTSMSDFSVFKFNLFFGAGSVTTGVRNILLYFYEQQYTRVKDSFDFGTELGQIFWFLFYPQEEYI